MVLHRVLLFTTEIMTDARDIAMANTGTISAGIIRAITGMDTIHGITGTPASITHATPARGMGTRRPTDAASMTITAATGVKGAKA